ncbi:TraB/GumN family protein [Treponema zioleckii]|uniref:TraB/GumN family protein n=1 Tax=Treponema zioleckii TaxID=331680 RepID=UPI00168B6D50|nr:TraB/GumN family protein [Treponema zioleckii]
MTKKIKLILSILFLSFLVISCASNQHAALGAQKAVLSKENDRLFWKISSTDKEGKPSYIYLQGTVHLGNDRIFPLGENVLYQFDNADRVYAEISSEDILKVTRLTVRLMRESFQRDGRLVTDSLSEKQNAVLAKYLNAILIKKFNAFEPWLFTMNLASSIYSDYGVDEKHGVDVFFYDRAKKQARSVGGLDTLETQIDLIRYKDYETQLFLLKDILDNVDEGVEQFKALYEAYVQDDVEKLKTVLNDSKQKDDEKNELYVEYHKKTLLDRNESWAKQITQFLKDGGSTFIYVGAGHLIEGKTVFDFLREMGTIE